MNALFVSAVLPWPLVSGGQVRIYNLLKRLSKKHEITLVSFIRDENEKKFLKNLSFCKKVYVVYRGKARQAKYLFRAITSFYPWLLASYENEKMRNLIRERMKSEQYDLVHIEPFYVFPSLPKHSIPLVVGEHNIEYKVYESYGRKFLPFLIDVWKIRLWEERIWGKATAITAVSPEDRSVIEKKTHASVTVVANGVDLANFPFRERPKHTDPIFLFAGDFTWFPNRDACKRLLGDIWPQLQTQFPNAELRIVGRNIPPGFSTRGARIVGEVSDIAKEYQSADILLAPVAIGGGTKFKMLEAMASGLPVITTQAGMQGLGTIAGVHYLRASTPEEFVAQTVEIWEHTHLCNTITKEARRLVEEKYSWDSIAQSLEHVWQSL